MSVRVEHGDCLEVMRRLAADGVTVDSVVCDPPYGLEFMGKGWDGADGFRRSLNAADAGRDSAFGRTSRRAPEYRTSGAGKIAAPGIGKRKTEWVSNQDWNQFRCGDCGHLFHGGSPCQCEAPQPVRADNRWNLFQVWCEEWARLAFALLPPGGHLLAFGGTRTYHRLACAIEDAGFEIRDQLAWAYGSGFPKSHDVAKAIDKACGIDVHPKPPGGGSVNTYGDGLNVQWRPRTPHPPFCAEARQWAGWGTALKPAWEPICLARKPLTGTVAANVMAHGTGALNIDGCRVGTTDDLNGGRYSDNKQGDDGNTYGSGINLRSASDYSRPLGRWPANLVHDGSDEVLQAFPDSAGQLRDVRGNEASRHNVYGKFNSVPAFAARNDSGSAARFFFSAKADADDRCDSKHPTVKPVALMRWLARLITPPGGSVLDPFAGSGTTGVACIREGFNAILIEREDQYVADIRHRLDKLSGFDAPLFSLSKT